MTCADPDGLASAAAVDFARRLVPHLNAALGTELLAACLIGSLAHGGFSRRYSDIDMALVTEAGLLPQALDRVRSEAAALSADWGPKVSVFWTDRHFSVGRFPPLDRIDYLDRAVVLMERERPQPARPTLEEIRSYLSGAPFMNWADRVRRFAASETLEPKDRKADCTCAPMPPCRRRPRPSVCSPNRASVAGRCVRRAAGRSRRLGVS
jgi:predicted nucleotidyltransferase